MADGWSITSQVQTSMQVPGEGFTDAMRVTFRTAKGVTGSVTIPLSMYGPGEVKRQIDAYVDAIHEVHDL